MDSEQELREYQREYLDFLDDAVSDGGDVELMISVYVISLQEDQGLYQEAVREMVRANSHRLIVNINDLRRKNAKRAAKYAHSFSLRTH